MELGNSVKDSVSNSVTTSVCNSVTTSVENSVWDQLNSSVRLVRVSVWASIIKLWYGNR